VCASFLIYFNVNGFHKIYFQIAIFFTAGSETELSCARMMACEPYNVDMITTLLHVLVRAKKPSGTDGLVYITC